MRAGFSVSTAAGACGLQRPFQNGQECQLELHKRLQPTPQMPLLFGIRRISPDPVDSVGSTMHSFSFLARDRLRIFRPGLLCHCPPPRRTNWTSMVALSEIGQHCTSSERMMDAVRSAIVAGILTRPRPRGASPHRVSPFGGPTLTGASGERWRLRPPRPPPRRPAAATPPRARYPCRSPPLRA